MSLLIVKCLGEFWAIFEKLGFLLKQSDHTVVVVPVPRDETAGPHRARLALHH